MAVSRTPDERELLAALSACSAKGPLVSAIDAWRGFKTFARTVPLDGGTGLLFQAGTYEFEGHPLFYFNPVCQFQLLNAKGEHDGFEQLHCELTCPASEALEGIDTHLWSFEFPNADAYFEAVEALPEFRRAVDHGNYRLRVSHELV